MECPLCNCTIDDRTRRCSSCGTALPFDSSEDNRPQRRKSESERRHNFMGVVGESHYQPALRAAFERHGKHVTASLEPEPRNTHDKNAVRVTIDRRLVGYLRRDVAKQFHQTIAGCGYRLEVPGDLRGGDEGKESLGVVLDFSEVYALHETNSPETKRCPFCAEEILPAAIVCKHCRKDLIETTALGPAFNPGVAAVLSLVLPGAGQVYKGEVGSGLFWFVWVILSYTFFAVIGLLFHAICVFDAARVQAGSSPVEVPAAPAPAPSPRSTSQVLLRVLLIIGLGIAGAVAVMVAMVMLL